MDDLSPDPGDAPALPVTAGSASDARAASGGGESEPLGFLNEELDAMLDGILSDVGGAGGARSEARFELARAETNIGLFSHLAIDELVEVLKLLDWQNVRGGEVIVRQDAPGNSMYIVSSGSVEAAVASGGTRTVIATFHEGEFFGEMAVLSGERRSATVTALESTELLELRRERLGELLSRHPEIEAKLRLAYDERKERNRARHLPHA